MAKQAREATLYSMQCLLSQATWDADGVCDEIRRFALETLGTAQLMTTLDETGHTDGNSDQQGSRNCSTHDDAG